MLHDLSWFKSLHGDINPPIFLRTHCFVICFRWLRLAVLLFELTRLGRLIAIEITLFQKGCKYAPLVAVSSQDCVFFIFQSQNSFPWFISRQKWVSFVGLYPQAWHGGAPVRSVALAWQMRKFEDSLANCSTHLLTTFHVIWARDCMMNVLLRFLWIINDSFLII